jgi:uncharacterized protein YcfJ
MKKVVYILVGLLLVAAVGAGTACTNTSTPAPAANQTITGTVTGNPVVTASGNTTITITTPSGPQIFPVNPVAASTFAGNACTLDQLDQLVADNVTYNCTIVYNANQGVLAINVVGQVGNLAGVIPPGTPR